MALLAFMPLAFGAVQEWSRFIVLLVSTGLLACLAVHAWRRRNSGGLPWSPAYVPMALFVFVALAQALPMPFGLIEWLSPHAANLYADLRQDVLGSFTFSLYPRATWQDLCIVICASIVFLTVVCFFRHASDIKRLLLAVATIGTFFAILALLQGIFSNGLIYWIGPAEVQANSGTFACHNHFSQHMVLSVMAMLAYAMIRTREVIGHSWLDKDSLSDWLTSRELRGVRWILLMAVLGLIAVVMSVSRMGTVSAVVAISAVVLMYAAKRGAKQANLPLLVGIVVLFAVVFIGSEMVFERMATLNDLDGAYESRWTVVKDTLTGIPDFLFVGSGLGTFSVVYPMYDTGQTWRFSSHAENEYVQLLMEMGLVGFALVAWFAATIAQSAAATLSRMNRPLYVAGPPLAAGLVAVMLHSWTDFGQHLPAIASLSAVFCGLLIVMGHRASMARRRRPVAVAASAADRKGPNVRRQIYTNALLGVMGMVLVLNVPANFLRVFAEEYDLAALSMSDRLREAKWHAPDSDYQTLIALGERAVQLDPGNVFYRYRLGVYRWWAVVRDRKPAELSDKFAGEVVQTASTIVDEMISSLASCPTMGSTHSWRGQLEWWVLGDAAGRQRVEHAVQLARNDRVTLHAAGVLAAVDQDPDLAFERFKRSVEVRGNMISAAEVLLEESKRPDLALALAGTDPQRLHEISSVLARRGYAEQSTQAREQSLDAYRGRIEDPNTPTWAIAMLADAAVKDGDAVEALSLYRRALAREYTQESWRASAVRCLIASGDLPEAERETDVLQRLNAKSALIETLRSEIAQARRIAATQQSADPNEVVE